MQSLRTSFLRKEAPHSHWSQLETVSLKGFRRIEATIKIQRLTLEHLRGSVLELHCFNQKTPKLNFPNAALLILLMFSQMSGLRKAAYPPPSYKYLLVGFTALKFHRNSKEK